MKTQIYFHHLAFFSAIFLSAVSAGADPIELPEKPITPEITGLISLAIFLEVVCILLVLRRSKKPRFFILWLIGIHLFTYPAFLGFLWLEQNMRPAFAAGIGRRIGGAGRGNFDLSDLPVYPIHGQIRLDRTIDYQVSARVIDWQCPFGFSVSCFTGDL